MNRKQTVQRCKKFLWGLLLTFASARAAFGDLLPFPIKKASNISDLIPRLVLTSLSLALVLILCFRWREKIWRFKGKILLFLFCLWLIWMLVAWFILAARLSAD